MNGYAPPVEYDYGVDADNGSFPDQLLTQVTSIRTILRHARAGLQRRWMSIVPR